MKALFNPVKSPLCERLCTAAFLLLIFQQFVPSLSHVITDLAYPLLLLGLAVMLKKPLRDCFQKGRDADIVVKAPLSSQP
jgi:hypothetical protein